MTEQITLDLSREEVENFLSIPFADAWRQAQAPIAKELQDWLTNNPVTLTEEQLERLQPGAEINTTEGIMVKVKGGLWRDGHGQRASYLVAGMYSPTLLTEPHGVYVPLTSRRIEAMRKANQHLIAPSHWASLVEEAVESFRQACRDKLQS